MDGSERADAGWRKRLGHGEQASINGQKGNPGQELVGIRKEVLSERQAAQLDAQQATGDALLEGADVAQDRGCVGLAKQEAPERAGVDIDGRHPSVEAL